MTSPTPISPQSPLQKVLRTFGLHTNPFGATPDPRFMYLGAAHREAIAVLQYGLLSNRGFLGLIASPGMGKTTTLFSLRDQLRDFASMAFVFQTQCNSRELLRQIGESFGLDNDGGDLVQFHKNFYSMLQEQSRAGRNVILFIDEAQRLDDDSLEAVRLLSNFETPEAKLLQLVLSGQPQLADRLASPQLAQLRQRISLITTLTALNRADVHAYVQHRLAVAGNTVVPIFSPQGLDQVASTSRGIPRLINNICFNSLSLAYAMGRTAIDAAIVEEATADTAIGRFAATKKRTTQHPPARPAASAARPPQTQPVPHAPKLPQPQAAPSVPKPAQPQPVPIARQVNSPRVVQAAARQPQPKAGPTLTKPQPPQTISTNPIRHAPVHPISNVPSFKSLDTREPSNFLRLAIAWIALVIISLAMLSQPGFRSAASNLAQKVFSRFVKSGRLNQLPGGLAVCTLNDAHQLLPLSPHHR